MFNIFLPLENWGWSVGLKSEVSRRNGPNPATRYNALLRLCHNTRHNIQTRVNKAAFINTVTRGRSTSLCNSQALFKAQYKTPETWRMGTRLRGFHPGPLGVVISVSIGADDVLLRKRGQPRVKSVGLWALHGTVGDTTSTGIWHLQLTAALTLVTLRTEQHNIMLWIKRRIIHLKLHTKFSIFFAKNQSVINEVTLNSCCIAKQRNFDRRRYRA